MSYPEKATLQSSDPRKVWKLSVYKPQGRPAYATAIEGVVESSGGVEFFTFAIHLGRSSHPAARVDIIGPATKKKREAAMKVLEAQLREAGLLRDPEVDRREKMADVAGGYAAL
jgi:hypothetical protein